MSPEKRHESRSKKKASQENESPVKRQQPEGENAPLSASMRLHGKENSLRRKKAERKAANNEN